MALEDSTTVNVAGNSCEKSKSFLPCARYGIIFDEEKKTHLKKWTWRNPSTEKDPRTGILVNLIFNPRMGPKLDISERVATYFWG